MSRPEKSVVGIGPLLHEVGERLRFVGNVVRVDPPFPEVVVRYGASDLILVE